MCDVNERKPLQFGAGAVVFTSVFVPSGSLRYIWLYGFGRALYHRHRASSHPYVGVAGHLLLCDINTVLELSLRIGFVVCFVAWFSCRLRCPFLCDVNMVLALSLRIGFLVCFVTRFSCRFRYVHFCATSSSSHRFAAISVPNSRPKRAV